MVEDGKILKVEGDAECPLKRPNLILRPEWNDTVGLYDLIDNPRRTRDAVGAAESLSAQHKDKAFVKYTISNLKA